MIRLLFLTDFTEQFAYRLLAGITEFSKESREQWVVSRMPNEYRRVNGFNGVVDFAKRWKADIVIGQFNPKDDVSVFRKYGIVALAQDYVSKFTEIHNITADYRRMGRIAADLFLSRGFRNFGFFGYQGVCWSDERFFGFRERIEEEDSALELHVYTGQRLDQMWHYDHDELTRWLQSVPKPIAIMSCDDNQGSLLLEACSLNGIRIPQDVSVIGVDNDVVLDNLTNPSLSSIEVDIERGGYEAAKMAVRMLRDPSYEGEDIVLRPVGVEARMSTSVFATGDEAVIKALQFIHANIESHITVPDILSVVPVSRRLLENRFKEVTGDTLYNYVAHQRIDHFASLLEKTNLSITEIAARMDEVDSKSISRLFKTIKGCTPSEYRASLTKQS